MRDRDEECDGLDIDSRVCGGGLVCEDDCTLDSSACCNDVPVQDGSCPDSFCDTCDGPCIADCNESNSCEDQTIDCPDGYECVVECNAFDACQGATINCPSEHACTVECSGFEACEGVIINCGTGPCTVQCGSGGDACDATVNCGLGECAATCEEGGSVPELTCGSACVCDPC